MTPRRYILRRGASARPPTSTDVWQVLLGTRTGRQAGARTKLPDWSDSLVGRAQYSELFILLWQL